MTANVSEAISAPKNTNKTFKNIHIQAKPDSIAIDTASTAVVVVDMENDFGSKGGMFDRAGINISMIQKVPSRRGFHNHTLLVKNYFP